jgi:hypothetical protein
MSTIADTTFQESLQGLANWLTYLEMKRSMYSQQLERARKQSPTADATPAGGNGAAGQSVFSDVEALKAAPAVAVAQNTDLGDSWLTVGEDTPADDDPLVTVWREDDPEMAAWDLDDEGDSIEDDAWAIASEVTGVAPITENGDAEEEAALSVDDAWALPGDDGLDADSANRPAAPEMALPDEDNDDLNDEAETGEDTDELPPSWL